MLLEHSSIVNQFVSKKDALQHILDGDDKPDIMVKVLRDWNLLCAENTLNEGDPDDNMITAINFLNCALH